MSVYREPSSKCPGCWLGLPPGSTECASCGAVWGYEHHCPHCERPARAVRGGAFLWSCASCSGVRLPARVARVLGPDPDGSLRFLFQDYTAWSRRVRQKQRAVVATVVVAPLFVAVVWAGLLAGEESVGATHVALAFAIAVVSAVVAVAVYVSVRDARDRAEAVAIDERGEIRRTYRRAAAMLLREEELTDDELAELVQSTRDVRRTRVAAGGHAPPTDQVHVAPDDGPVSQGPRSSEEAPVSGGAEHGGAG